MDTNVGSRSLSEHSISSSDSQTLLFIKPYPYECANEPNCYKIYDPAEEASGVSDIGLLLFLPGLILTCVFLYCIFRGSAVAPPSSGDMSSCLEACRQDCRCPEPSTNVGTTGHTTPTKPLPSLEKCRSCPLTHARLRTYSL